MIKRTRTKRTFAPVLGAEEGMGRGGLEGEEEGEVGECFDDGDFYQQILREVVESRMLDLGAFFIFHRLPLSSSCSALLSIVPSSSSKNRS